SDRPRDAAIERPPGVASVMIPPGQTACGGRASRHGPAVMRAQGDAMIPQPLPPFRADQVGSLLRPLHLAQAREKHRRGEIDAASRRAAEDDAIREAVAHQEEIGLQGITDGEFRRDWWHLDFLSRLEGVSLATNPGSKFNSADAEQPPIATVTGR